MITEFSEIAFLSDRDLSALLSEVNNHVLLMALYETPGARCDSFVRERIVSRFSYVGWKIFEMDCKLICAANPGEVVACQENIIEIANHMIEEREFSDYYISRFALS